MFLNIHKHSLAGAKKAAQPYVDRGYKVDEPNYFGGVYTVTVHRRAVTAKGYKDLTRKTKIMRAEGWIPVEEISVQAGRLTQIFTRE